VKCAFCDEVSLSKYIVVKYFLPSNSPQIIIFLYLFYHYALKTSIYYSLKEVTKRSIEMLLVKEHIIVQWWTVYQESG
jgi:hypothetical protein